MGCRDHGSPSTALGLYVHVPFCSRRCGYCAFVTYAPGEPEATDMHLEWAEAAVAEVGVADGELRRLIGRDRPPLTSVYFGGGTPTLVEQELLGRVLLEIRRRFELSDDLEVSFEANPDGLRDTTLSGIADLGATRVSFGMQSAVPRVLELLDRTHDPESVPKAVAAARAAGIASVSLDLIHGTPGETAEDWSQTLDAALELAPDHLSAYALGIEPATKLAARVRSGELAEPSPDDAADRYELLDARTRSAGLTWYEVSNWARTDADRCRHNLLYWRDHDWWGIGPGAHSHVGDIRWWNHAGLEAWAGSVRAGAIPAVGRERRSDDERRTEQIMLGIRLSEGVPTSWAAPASVQRLVEDGLVALVPVTLDGDERVALTSSGRLLADLVVRRLRWGDRAP